MKSILVIGVGRFGKHIAKKMLDLGNDVVIVDKEEEKVERLNNIFSDSFIGDCRNEGVLRSLGINNFDICFVCIGIDFQASLEITSMLKELGAKKVVSLAKRDRQAALLLKIGADDVIYPEREIAEKTGIKYNAKNVFDLIKITDEYAIYEIPVVPSWVGKTVVQVNVRKVYKINIVAINNNEELIASPGADYVFRQGDHIMVIGKQEDVFRLSDKT